MPAMQAIFVSVFRRKVPYLREPVNSAITSPCTVVAVFCLFEAIRLEAIRSKQGFVIFFRSEFSTQQEGLSFSNWPTLRQEKKICCTHVRSSNYESKDHRLHYFRIKKGAKISFKRHLKLLQNEVDIPVFSITIFHFVFFLNSETSKNPVYLMPVSLSSTVSHGCLSSVHSNISINNNKSRQTSRL